MFILALARAAKIHDSDGNSCHTVIAFIHRLTRLPKTPADFVIRLDSDMVLRIIFFVELSRRGGATVHYFNGLSKAGSTLWVCCQSNAR